jgi:hypothetical protein
MPVYSISMEVILSLGNPGVGYYDDLAKIYIYGQNFAFYPPGAQTGFLTGNWLDENETSFRIYLRGMLVPFEQALGINIFLVPEPTTFCLFGLTSLFLREKAFLQAIS